MKGHYTELAYASIHYHLTILSAKNSGEMNYFPPGCFPRAVYIMSISTNEL